MIRKIPTPERPHFIFSGKMWEIENEFKEIAGQRRRTVVTFEHIIKTQMLDDDHNFNCQMKLAEGHAWTITETVVVAIDDEFSDPEITMIKKNTGSMVNKEPKGKNRVIPAIETLSLPLYHIQKLVKEAEKIDIKNRFLSNE